MTALIFILGAAFGYWFRAAWIEASAADRLEALRGYGHRRWED